MATLIHDCPHCGAVNMSFAAVHGFQSPIEQYCWSVHLICQACFRGVVAMISDGGIGRNPIEHPGDLMRTDARGYKCIVMDVWPKSPSTNVPESLPDNVAKAFKEGCEVLNQSPSAACSQFRKTLELALKDKSPDIEAWKLEKRIEKMADTNLLTPALKDWAHKLRLDGNDAIHVLEDVTREYAQEMERLTRFVLLYLFSLPESVKAAQLKK